MMIRNICFLLCVTVGSSATSQTIIRPDGRMLTVRQIDHIVEKLMDTAQVTGMGGGVVNNGRLAYINSYGYKNKSQKTLNDTGTCFYAASLSKATFAYIIMQLAGEHKFDLDKPIYRYRNMRAIKVWPPRLASVESTWE